MNTYEINAGTLTYAMKAVSLLNSHDISASYKKSVQSDGKGCGFVVTVKTDNIAHVKKLLSEKNIPVKSIVKKGNEI